MRPNDDTIWGNINTCFEIMLEIYYITAENKKGIAMSKEKAENSLSDEALKKGEVKDDYIYFDESSMNIPLYELMQKRLEMIKKMQNETMEMMKNLKENAPESAKDYFTYFKEPKIEGSKEKLREGVYTLSENSENYLAVHKNIAELFLSPSALNFGRAEGDYFYFNNNVFCIALNELKDSFEEIKNKIISMDSLNATLCTNYPYYVDEYNKFSSQENKINPVDSPINMFMQHQLDKEIEVIDKAEFEERFNTKYELNENIFDEQIDYSF